MSPSGRLLQFLSAACGLSLGLGREGEEKEAAVADFTLHTDLTAQFFHDAAHDRQAQPVPCFADLADLGEGSKQALPSLRGEPGTVIACPEADHAVRLEGSTQLECMAVVHHILRHC